MIGLFLGDTDFSEIVLKKVEKLKINQTNKNEILALIGPPSTKSTFDNDVYIYIERKTSGSKLTKLGKKKLIKNDVLVLEVDNKGILLTKNFYNKNDMKELNFDEERHTCNLGLYFSFDIDNSSFDSTLDFDSFILFERNLEKSSNLISRINFNDIRYRGPPSV